MINDRNNFIVLIVTKQTQSITACKSRRAFNTLEGLSLRINGWVAGADCADFLKTKILACKNSAKALNDKETASLRKKNN